MDQTNSNRFFKFPSFNNTQIDKKFNQTDTEFRHNSIEKIFTPRINNNSNQIAKKNGIENKYIFDRLKSNSNDFNTSYTNQAEILNKFQQDLTFKPIISKNSIDIMKNKPKYNISTSTFERN